MSIMHWRPMREFDSLRHQMDRLFEDFLLADRTWDKDFVVAEDNIVWQPSIELKERDSDLVVKVQIPGVLAEDLDIHVSQTAISIGGEHREETESEAGNIYRSEFRYGKFQRIVPLPVPVKHDAVSSEFRDGVLTLILPKETSVLPKAVKVDVAKH